VLEADITAHAKHPVLRDEAIERLLEFDISLRSGMRKSEQYNLWWFGSRLHHAIEENQEWQATQCLPDRGHDPRVQAAE
jgi:hypothetical protein